MAHSIKRTLSTEMVRRTVPAKFIFSVYATPGKRDVVSLEGLIITKIAETKRRRTLTACSKGDTSGIGFVDAYLGTR